MGYKFVKTEDNSVGLYDDTVNDIYHSSFGAYTEAIEKFVLPAQIERFKNSSCKVMDICYGIGYNTKALLNYSAENSLNINFKIDALEINEELIQLSPFINSIKNNSIYFETDKFLLKSILKQNQIDFFKIKKIASKNNRFLNINKQDFIKILNNYGYKYNTIEKINAFLHNIYYHNISPRNKKGQKPYNFSNSFVKWHINDARKAIFSLDENYDIVFHDGFTASKQPILWTIDFLSLITKKMNKNTGILVSYSSASPFRKALLDLGLTVGKFYNCETHINTTIASFNKNLIKYNLNSFELGLLNTKAGIVYEDENLNFTSKTILQNHKLKAENSILESTSSYYKRNNKKHGQF